jgi:hypothetical protein
MKTIVTVSDAHQAFHQWRRVEHKTLAHLGNYLKKNKMRDQSNEIVNNPDDSTELKLR